MAAKKTYRPVTLAAILAECIKDDGLPPELRERAVQILDREGKGDQSGDKDSSLARERYPGLRGSRGEAK